MAAVLANSHIGLFELAFVYLLVNSEHTRFKIGFSIDPLQRLKSIATKIDMDYSRQVSCTPSDVRRLEKVLHAWFDDFRIHPDLIDDPQGHTEWFEINCWDKVISYLNHNHEWLRCTVPAPLNASPTVHAARRRPLRGDRRSPCSPQPQSKLAIDLGGVTSMADLMMKTEASLNKSIIGMPITMSGSGAANFAAQEWAFGRLLWEASALHKRGIIRLGRVDLQLQSFTFTRLSEEAFDTKSLYAIKSAASRATGRRGIRPVDAGPPSKS